MEAPVTTLEICDDVVSSPTADDIERALQRQPRDDDWAMTLSRPNDDYMDAYVLADGSFQVECDANDRNLRSASVVDEATLKSLFLSFLAGDDFWSRQCNWVTPLPVTSLPSGEIPKALIAMVGAGIVLVIALAWAQKKEWILVLFALLFPGVIAYAAVAKMREARRAATWTQGTARILKSELASVPVFYNPANPKESVLERELPKNFALIFVFAAVLAVVLVSGALWAIGVIR